MRLATGWTSEMPEFETRSGQKFSLFHVVQIGYAAYSPPSIAEVKKTWIYTSTSPYAFIA
jgi:hypothetical protein